MSMCAVYKTINFLLPKFSDTYDIQGLYYPKYLFFFFGGGGQGILPTDWSFFQLILSTISIMSVSNTIRKITARVGKTAAFTDRDSDLV